MQADSNSDTTLDGGIGDDSLFVAAGRNNDLHGGDGNDWLGTNGLFHSLYGGAGDDWMGATGDTCDLFGESGNDTVFGVGSGHLLVGGDGNDWVGVSGNGNRLIGEAGNDYVAATGSLHRLDGGPGNDQLVAAAGHLDNIYFFRPGSGQDSITGFEGANNDRVDLRGFGLADFTALQPYISQVGAGTPDSPRSSPSTAPIS